MKKIMNILMVVLTQFFFTNCVASNNNVLIDGKPKELELVVSYKTGENSFFKTLNEYPIDVFLYKEDMFLLNYSDNKLIILNTEKRTTRTIVQVNNLIKKYSELYSGVKQIIVNDKYFFIAFSKAVICTTKEGIVKQEFLVDKNVDFFTVNKDIIFIFSSDNILSYNINGSILDKYKTDNLFTGHFLSIDNKVYIINGSEFNIYDISNYQNITSKKSAILSQNFYIKEPYLGCINSSFTIWFPYFERNSMALYNKENNDFVKNINLGENIFKPTDDDIRFEEGLPNFKIVSNDKKYFIISIKKNIINIYQI